MAEILYRVIAPHFVAGLITDETGRIIRTAPILSWSRGKSIQQTIEYFNRKNWQFEIVN